MSSFWEKIVGQTWRPKPEPRAEAEDADAEETSSVRMRVPRYLEGARTLIFSRLHRIMLRKRRRKRLRRSSLVRLRERVQLRALQMLAPAKDAQTEIYARARLEHAELTECYTCEQEISRNPSKKIGESSTGRIELRIPYDGYKYFTRQARADVANATRDKSLNQDSYAGIGHLLLTNYGNTDLDALLNLSDHYGAAPIRVPVAADGRSSMDDLTSDRKACVIAHDYVPSLPQPRVHPIDVQIDLLDPDSLGSLAPNLPAERGYADIDDIVAKMTQQVNFRPYLWLHMIVSLHLPCKSRNASLEPKITKMALDWPTITSLDALSLTVSGDEVPLRYNPESQSIEWFDVPLKAADDQDDNSEIQLFRNSEIFLEIKQPGELYRQPSLDGQVDVEVPGYLMSGLECRLYGATGALSRNTKPELVCKISTRIRLILDDAFAKRIFSPWQQLYFDEIVPEDPRITDIVTALQDRGFQVRSQVLPNDRQDSFLFATRREGPDYMTMWLLVERRRHQTERQNKLPGGHTYKSVFESGDLRVFIRGYLPRGSSELTHEMNALQLALRERFERVRARR